jgi:hypothetical protein
MMVTSTRETVEETGVRGRMLDVDGIRADFPILHRRVHGRPLVYLDNAATTQKPQAVIDALSRYYTEANANVHRGVHFLSGIATDAYESARSKVRAYFNAGSEREIVFTRNATESINLVAHAFVRPRLGAGDEVLISAMEHHSNIVPWQLVCQERGATLRVAPIDDSGELILDELERLLTDRGRSPCSWMDHRRHTTCRWTFARSVWIFMPRPATSCTARRASAFSTAARRCWRRCRRFSAAET